MSHRYPPRRRDQPRLGDEFVDYDPYQPYQQSYEQPYEQPSYGAYDPYEQYVPRNSVPSEPRSPPKSSPPRRRKSEKHRRAPSPIYYEEPSNSSRRHGKRAPRHEEDRRGRSTGPDRRGRGPSPPPFAAEPEPSRRHHRSSRAERDARRKSEPRFMDPYEQDFYTREPASRHYPSEPRERSGRDRDMDRDLDRDRSHRSRSVRELPSEHRSRGRSSRHAGMEDGNEYMTTSRRQPGMDDGNEYMMASRRHPGMDDDNEYATTSRRRPRSQTRGRKDRAPSGPSPTRGRPPPTSRGREPTKRRSSMPATTKNGTPWWQNPLVQAGARTALTAGAQAAMKSRNDQGDWLGAKGAKIATAALGAALVDGFIGQKHPDSTRHNIAKQGVDLASSKAASGADRAARHHRS